MGSDVCADVVVDGGGQSQVEESMGIGSRRQRRQVSAELGERVAIIITASKVGVLTEEG